MLLEVSAPQSAHSFMVFKSGVLAAELGLGGGADSPCSVFGQFYPSILGSDKKPGHGRRGTIEVEALCRITGFSLHQ